MTPTERMILENQAFMLRALGRRLDGDGIEFYRVADECRRRAAEIEAVLKQEGKEG